MEAGHKGGNEMHPYDELVDETQKLEEATGEEEIFTQFNCVTKTLKKVIQLLNLCDEDLAHIGHVKGGEEWRLELSISAICLSGSEGERSRVLVAQFKWQLGRLEQEITKLRSAAA